MSRAITYALAIVMTAAALAMAVASAWGRADALADQLTLAALSVCIVLAVHLLPALGAAASTWGRVAIAAVWPLCLVAAMVGHAGFFLNAWAASAQAQAAPAQQRQADARAAQRQALEEAIAGIRARSATTVATQLATARAAAEQGQTWATPARIERLQIELAEAQRAARLRDELVTLAGAASQAAGDNSAALASDPVTRSFVAITGASIAAVQLAVNGLLAVLVEVLGCLLWWLALTSPARPKAPVQLRTEAKPQPQASEPARADADAESAPSGAEPEVTASELARLRQAVRAGALPSEGFIRQLLRCSPQKARAVRRQYLGAHEPAAGGDVPRPGAQVRRDPPVSITPARRTGRTPSGFVA